MSKSIERTTGLMQLLQSCNAAEPEIDAIDAAEASAETARTDESVSPDELQQMQQEKIDSIRRAIASGAYDSDELLQLAMERMLQRIADDEDGEEVAAAD